MNEKEIKRLEYAFAGGDVEPGETYGDRVDAW